MYLEQFPPANHGPSSQTQSRTAKNWWPEDTSTHDIRVSNLQNSGEKQTWFRVKPLVPKNNWLTNDIEWLFPKYGEIGLTHSQILTSYLLDCKNFAQRAFRVGSCFRLPWNVMGWSNRQTKMKPPVRVMNYPEQRLMCWILWTCFHQKCFFFNNEWWPESNYRTCHDIVSGEWVQRVPEKKVTNPVGFFFVAPHRALSQLACHSEQERLPRSVPGGTNKLAAGLLDLLDLLSFQNHLKSCAKVRNAKLLPTQTMDSLKWLNQALNHGFSADGFSPDSPQPL